MANVLILAFVTIVFDKNTQIMATHKRKLRCYLSFGLITIALSDWYLIPDNFTVVIFVFRVQLHK